MTRRYYVPNLPASGGGVTLPKSESHHAIRVMRVKIGDEVDLFDGQGSESQATVVELSRNECHCDVQPPTIIDREPGRSIHLGIALPKPDRARELIERLTELGVQTITPLVTDRTQRPPSDSLIEKLRKGVVEACKQSGRNRLLQIMPTIKAHDYFAEQSTIESPRWIAHPTPDAVTMKGFSEAPEITAAIGPEGGWTDAEFHSAVEHGFAPVQLGKRIYRIETAATVIAAVLSTASQ